MFDACKHLLVLYFYLPIMINQAKRVASYAGVAIIYSTDNLFYSAEGSFVYTKL